MSDSVKVTAALCGFRKDRYFSFFLGEIWRMGVWVIALRCHAGIKD